MIYWAKRRCSPGAEIPFMKALGDLQLKLGAPHELMMLSSHPLSHQTLKFSSEFRSASSLRHLRDLPKSKKTNSPTSLSRSLFERTNSTNASRQLLQSGVPRRK